MSTLSSRQPQQLQQYSSTTLLILYLHKPCPLKSHQYGRGSRYSRVRCTCLHQLIHLLIPHRLFEDDLLSVIDARTDSLQSLRELGPPDLVHLVKNPIKGAQKQVRQVFNAQSSY